MIFLWKRTDPVKALMKAMIAAKKASKRLEAMENVIRSRKRSLLEKAIKLEELGNDFLAKKYVEEAKRIENIAQRLSYMRLVFEKLGLSLELALSFRNFSKTLNDVVDIVNLLKKLPESTIPELNLLIYELETNVREALNNMNTSGVPSSIPTVHSDEAEKILKEAKAIAKQRLMEELNQN